MEKLDVAHKYILGLELDIIESKKNIIKIEKNLKQEKEEVLSKENFLLSCKKTYVKEAEKIDLGIDWSWDYGPVARKVNLDEG